MNAVPPSRGISRLTVARTAAASVLVAALLTCLTVPAAPSTSAEAPSRLQQQVTDSGGRFGGGGAGGRV